MSRLQRRIRFRAGDGLWRVKIVGAAVLATAVAVVVLAPVIAVGAVVTLGVVLLGTGLFAAARARLELDRARAR